MAKDLSVNKSTKNKKMVIVLLVAILLAALVAFGIYQMLTPQRTTVYIFNADYSAGTQVTTNMLQSIEVDSNIIVGSDRMSTGDFIITESNYAEILTTAGVLRNDVYAGNVFTTSMLSTTGGNRIEMVMKKNAVAVTVDVNNITGVTTGLAYGSRVNVYANYNESTILLLQNTRVLAVGKDSNGAVSSVTLEVNLGDSMRVIHACNYGEIHLGLVDVTGYQETEEDGLIYNNAGFSKQQ